MCLVTGVLRYKRHLTKIKDGRHYYSNEMTFGHFFVIDWCQHRAYSSMKSLGPIIKKIESK